jgi:hypothetical protein
MKGKIISNQDPRAGLKTRLGTQQKNPIKTFSTMNSRHNIRELFARAILLLGLGVAALVATPFARGQLSIYKAGNTTDISTPASWTLSTGGAGGNPSAVNVGDLGIIDSTVMTEF